MVEFKDMKCILRSKYSASHVYDADSVTNILKTYVVEDKARNLRQAATPTGRALAVTEGLSFLEALAKDNGNDTVTGDTFTIGPERNISVETKATSRRRATGRRSSRATYRHYPSTSRSPSHSPSPR